jgi:hypothetical protein
MMPAMRTDENVYVEPDMLIGIPSSTSCAQISEANHPNERRRSLRISMPDWSPIQIQTTAGRLVNLSASGALVEFTRLAWPGRICHVTFPLQEAEVQLLARAIHASVGSHMTDPSGRDTFLFRIGMKFVGLSQATQELISEYLSCLTLRRPTV